MDTRSATQNLAFRWAVLGAVLSTGAPAGLWLVRRFAGESATLEYAYTGVSTCIVFVLFGLFAGRLADSKTELAVRDRLTGLHNRHHLGHLLPRLRALTTRRGTPLAIMVLDLDRFKRVNDRYGHDVGDKTLVAVAKTLADSLREADLVARFGGEEFVVAAADTDGAAALDMAERVRVAVSQLGPEVLGHPGPQTISIGIAASTTAPEDELLRRADAALYEAKDAGRDRVIVASDTPAKRPPGAARAKSPDTSGD